MECVVGKLSSFLDAAALAMRVAAYDGVLVDLGTGDGRFVREMAETDPGCLAIGIDLCREQLVRHSRAAPDNTLFVVANARALPPELAGVATRLTINFPWAELLRSLAGRDQALLAGLVRLIDPTRGGELLIRLNGAALSGPASREIGQIARSLQAAGFGRPEVRQLEWEALRAVPTSWAKRLAFGRDPRTWEFRASVHPVLTTIRAETAEFVASAAAW